MALSRAIQDELPYHAKEKLVSKRGRISVGPDALIFLTRNVLLHVVR